MTWANILDNLGKHFGLCKYYIMVCHTNSHAKVICSTIMALKDVFNISIYKQ